MKALGEDIIEFLESPHAGGRFLFGHVLRIQDERSGAWLLRKHKMYDLAQLGRFGRAEDWAGEIHHPVLVRSSAGYRLQAVAILKNVREVFGEDFPVVDKAEVLHEPFEPAFLNWKCNNNGRPNRPTDAALRMLSALYQVALQESATRTGLLVLRHFKLHEHPDAQRVVRAAAKEALNNLRIRIDE